jgi:hypothetical protein
MAEFKIDRLRFTWAGPWVTGTNYSKDSVVSFNGQSYVCLINHLAGNFNNDLNNVGGDGIALPYWTLMLDGHTWIGTWGPSTNYSLNNIIIFGGNAYICKYGHTSGLTFDPYYWDVYGTFDSWKILWDINTTYGTGDIVRYGGMVYRCIRAHTSIGSLTAGLESDIDNWSVLVNNIEYLGAWDGGIVRYKSNDVVTLGAEAWICTTGHLSDATFDPTKWTVWIPGIEYGGTWDAAILYQVGDVVTYGGYSYVNNTPNNINNVPSIDATDWTLFTKGYELKSAWSNVTNYKVGSVVTIGGSSFVAIADNLNQNPTAVSLTTTYVAAGSSGTTVKVSSITGILPGMIVSGVGFIQGQIVKSVSSGTLVLNGIPDTVNPPVDGQTLTLLGINYVYWNPLVQNEKFRAKWTVGTVYDLGDTASWKNATYKCILRNTASVLNRPDVDITNTYWVLFLQNDVYNALNDQGDIVSFRDGKSLAVPIGTESYILKSVNQLPTWSTIFITPNVYYVATNGIDSPERGTTWDIPWKTIKYATDIVAKGVLNQNARYLLTANKEYIVSEAYEWMAYQRANNLSPFAQGMGNFPDQTKTKRDTRYIIDAVIYDVARGGNSQTVANTLEFFDTEYGNKFKTPGIAAEITYFIAVVNYVYSLVNSILGNTAPALDYQGLNGVYSTFTTTATATAFGTNLITVGDTSLMTVGQPIVFNGTNIGNLVSGTTYYIVEITDSAHIKIFDQPLPNNGVLAMIDAVGIMTAKGTGTRTYQTIDVSYTTEAGVIAKVATLQEIMITAFTRGSTSLIPPMNQGATATIFIKSGTYAEQIPITVPANAAIVGDELRGTTVTPANAVKTLCTRTRGGGINTFTVGSTNNMFDGTPVQFVSLNPVSTASGFAYIDTTFGNVIAGQTYYVIGDTITSSTFKVRVAGNSVASIGLGAAGSGYSQGLTTTTTAPQTVGGVTAVITAQVDLATGSITTYSISNVGAGYTSAPTVTVTKPADATANFISGGVTTSIVVDTVVKTIYKGMTASGTGITSGQTVLDVEFDTPNFAQVTVTLSAPPDDIPTGIITFSDTGTGAIPGQTTITQQNVPFSLFTNSGFMYVYGGGALGDMFRLQNGTGLRNMTFSGMLGTLSAANSYGTRRPTGGSCVALDPGTGPDDTSAWIISKSPYIQNCTNFGSGAVGMKVDSTIHNGGQHSMVCNDFTQILSDGIGVWVTGGGALVEAVSVFAYFCYAGYLSENGGRSRATNGNSSYGSFGVLSEGFDSSESPITGQVNNRASQATSSAISSFGASAQILKIQYTNAGQSYGTSVTNMLKYTNNFLGADWVNDGNVVLSQGGLNPFSVSEAWSLTATTSVTDSSYIYQDMTISPSGGKFTNIAGANISGSGTSATFDVTVTPNGYVVTVNAGGSNYVVSNQILILGSTFGGQSPDNDLTITVATVQAPSAVLTVTSQGTVPTGTNQYYSLSIYAKQGTSNAFDMYATFSGGIAGSVSSSVTYNFITGAAVGASQDNGGSFPISVSAIPQTGGWYRITMTLNDATGLNNNLQFRIYPRTRTGIAGTTYFYGAQTEIGGLVNYYLENDSNTYSAYANYKINGAGTGAIAVGDEIRSGAAYQSVIVSGGTGFVTANNNAQGGNSGSGYLVLAQSDTATVNTYTGMRLLITSGLGAGQYGYVASFDPNTKYAYVLKESFTPLTCLTTTSGTNDISVGGTSDINTLFPGQMVQFIPTTFTTTVLTISQNQVTATQTIGGLTNVIVVSSTARLALNMGITFTGTTFGQITSGYTYYIVNIVDSTKIQISTTYGGVIWTLVDGSGSMNVNYPANTGYLQGSTTNMLPNYSIQFTGAVLGDIVVGQYYYVNDVVDSNTFTISSALRTLIVTNTTVSTDPTRPNQITVNASTDTGLLTPLNPIYFTGTAGGGLNTTGTKYYISNIPDTLHFTVSSTLITTTATQAQTASNLITVTSTAGFVSGNPIQFTGTVFGTIQAGVTYYVAVINSGTTFTISTTPGGGAFNLGPTTTTGSIICRTSGANATLTTASVTITGTTTTPQIKVAAGTGSMTGTFQPPLFGGVSAGTNYYILSTSTVSGNTFKIKSTFGGSTAINLNTGVGSMQVAWAGWDNINPGTPDTSVFDSTSTYFIEPRLQFSAPTFSSSTATGPSLAIPTVYSGAAHGAGRYMVIASSGIYAYYSNNLGQWTNMTLPTNSIWTSIAYGNQNWVILSAGQTGSSAVALYSNSNGAAWKSTTMPSSSYWSEVTFGNGKFVAVSQGRYYTALTTVIVSSTAGAGLVVSIGTIGTAYTVNITSSGTGFANGDTVKVLGTNLGGASPANDCTITIVSQAGGFVQSISSAGTAVTGGNAQPAYSINYGATWTTGSGISTLPWKSVTFGLGKFVAVARGSRNVATSTNGSTWTVTTNALPTASNWSKVTYGNNKFVAVSSTAAQSAYSLDGITWYQSPYTITADTVVYGQGVYLAQNATSNPAYVSEDGILWIQKTVSVQGSVLVFGYPQSSGRGTFLSLNGATSAATIFAGTRPQARPSVVGGVITAVTLWEPGSNYSAPPTLSYIDPNNTSDASVTFRTENGVLGGPSFVARGTGFNTASTTIDIRGNGVADNYQIGLNLYVNGLTKLPAPGDNLTIGASSTIYKVTSATALYGTIVPNITGLLTISPALTALTAPVHSSPIQIRQRYSQVRLTNHDFLNIGYGNTYQSNYPGFPEDTGLNKANYTVESNNGRVFYSSTDQDGNFSVGGLFGVEQATGIVTLSASQFGLTGLSQLKLGGVSVGSSQIIISAFSTDSSFLANSNTLIPTQKAIKAYLTGRLSQGGSNTFTGLLTAGTVQVGGPDKIGSTVTEGQSGWVVNMKNKVMVNGQFGGVDGDLSALSFFFKSQGFRG